MAYSPSREPLGRLVVIEGADGTGKSTQLSVLAERLRSEGLDVVTYDFPHKSGSPVGDLIGNFLRGKYGPVTPEFLSLAFSIDRLTSKDPIIRDLAEGRHVLCDRYVASNIAFQTAKLDDAQRKENLEHLLTWVEYDVFGLPRPDIQFNMVADDAYFLEGHHLTRSADPQRLYTQGKADVHESAVGLQVAVNQYYRSTPESAVLRQIGIVRDGVRLPPQNVSDEIWKTLWAEGAMMDTYGE